MPSRDFSLAATGAAWQSAAAEAASSSSSPAVAVRTLRATLRQDPAESSKYSSRRQAATLQRKAGLVPGILFGGSKNSTKVLISVDSKELNAELRTAGRIFEHQVYELEVAAGGSDSAADDAAEDPAAAAAATVDADTGAVDRYTVVPRQLQRHVVTDEILNLNFQLHDSNKGTRVDIPIEYYNYEQCRGLQAGGYINHVFRAIPCVCTGDQFPVSLRVDLKGLRIGRTMRLDEIEFPEGCKPVTGGKKGNNYVISNIRGKKSADVDDDEDGEDEEEVL